METLHKIFFNFEDANFLKTHLFDKQLSSVSYSKVNLVLELNSLTDVQLNLIQELVTRKKIPEKLRLN